jgi:hypothetical protein
VRPDRWSAADTVNTISDRGVVVPLLPRSLLAAIAVVGLGSFGLGLWLDLTHAS